LAAGANRLESGAEDGILTALEAAALDLWGTQLLPHWNEHMWQKLVSFTPSLSLPNHAQLV
jgi:hypothetical protein